MEDSIDKSEPILERDEIDCFMMEYEKRMLDGCAMQLAPIVLDDIIREFLDIAQQINMVARA